MLGVTLLRDGAVVQCGGEGLGFPSLSVVVSTELGHLPSGLTHTWKLFSEAVSTTLRALNLDNQTTSSRQMPLLMEPMH